MIKPSVNLQELRRRIYRKAKAELAGRGGVADSVKVLPAEQAYSALWRRAQESRMTERVTSGLRWRGLETGLR